MKEKKLFLIWSISIIIILGGSNLFGVNNSNNYTGYPLSIENGSQSISIDKISKANIGEKISISGEITSSYSHEDGHLFLVFSDGSAKIDVPIFKNTGINTSELKTYSSFTIKGKIGEYNGKLQLVPETQSDIVRR